VWRGGLGGAYPLTDPFVCRCLSSPTMLRFHTPLIEPDVRISRIRLSDKASCVRPREGLPIGQAPPSLRHAVPPAAPEPEWVDRLMPVSRSFAASCTGLELRPLPSTGITRLHRYYGPLRHPTRPRLALTGCGLEVSPSTAGASRVALSLPVRACRRHYPDGTARCFARLARRCPHFPVSQAGRLPYHPFRGLLSVYSRCGLHARRVALRPSTPEVPVASSPPQLLRLLLAGATVARRELHPLKTGAFSRHTEKCGLSSFCCGKPFFDWTPFGVRALARILPPESPTRDRA